MFLDDIETGGSGGILELERFLISLRKFSIDMSWRQCFFYENHLFFIIILKTNRFIFFEYIVFSY